MQLQGNTANIRAFLEEKVATYNRPAFITDDPICIPHLFTAQADREIAGFFAAIFAWGNRTTIIAKSRELMQRMDMQPHQFVLQASAAELRALEGFKHRTFTPDDLYYFIHFFRKHYSSHPSLETAFSQWMLPGDKTTQNALSGFRNYFFADEHLPRTRKHISTPLSNSSCKRLCMYLRWMVRCDGKGVDFGLWKQIKPAQLVCPLDLHVVRVAKRFGMLQTAQPDWKAALELTSELQRLDPKDPVKFDFALFSLGIIEKF